MDRKAIAKACGVDESWFDDWARDPISIYPAYKETSGTYTRSRPSEGAGPGTWTLQIGSRTRQLTALEASRTRYALDRLCVPHMGRPSVKRSV